MLAMRLLEAIARRRAATWRGEHRHRGRRIPMRTKLRLLFLAAAGLTTAWGQKDGGAAGSSNATSGASISSVTPGWTSNPTTTAFTMISGAVKMDDGSP